MNKLENMNIFKEEEHFRLHPVCISFISKSNSLTENILIISFINYMSPITI